MTTFAHLHDVHRQSKPPRRVVAVALVSTTIGGFCQLALMASLGYLLAWSAARPTLGAIAGVLALVELLAFLRAPLRYFDRLRSHGVAFAALKSWRLWLFDRLIPLSPAGLGTQKTGDVLSTAMSDVDGIGDLYIRVVLPLFGTVVPFLAGVTVLGFINGWAASVVLLATCAGFALIWHTTTRGANLVFERAQAQGERAAILLDAFHGASTLSSARGWSRPIAKAAAQEQRISAIAKSLENNNAVRTAVAAVVSGLVVICALGAVMHPRHELEVRLAIAMVTMALALGELLSVAASALGGLDGVLAAWRRLADLAALEPPPNAGELLLPAQPLDVAAFDLGLTYPLATVPAVSHLTFTLRPASRTVITGPSGSGKTSVLIGLLGLWPFQQGELSISGIALPDLDHQELRRAIGTHLSSSQLFSGTVRSNLDMTEATEADMVAALEAVGLHPGREVLDRTLGDQGKGLSGGEQLRVCVVRALLGSRLAVVLDEPLAQLDERSAALVRSAIATHAPQKTVIVVSHERADFADFDELRLRLAR